MLEREGFRIAAISYDSREALQRFAENYRIGFPLLSDRDSAVIRSFGIFNTNIAPGLRAHGVPHPVEYLVAPDGVIIRKYFVPNYQHRVTASAVALREFGAAGEKASFVKLRHGALTVKVGLGAARAFAGQEIGFLAEFSLEAGWHVYGAPLPKAYTATSITFDDPKVIRQSFELPPAAYMRFGALEETLPIYRGSFRGLGALLLRFPMDAGDTRVSGRVCFQQCSETACEPPQVLAFELPLTVQTFLVPTPRK